MAGRVLVGSPCPGAARGDQPATAANAANSGSDSESRCPRMLPAMAGGPGRAGPLARPSVHGMPWAVSTRQLGAVAGPSDLGTPPRWQAARAGPPAEDPPPSRRAPYPAGFAVEEPGGWRLRRLAGAMTAAAGPAGDRLLSACGEGGLKFQPHTSLAHAQQHLTQHRQRTVYVLQAR